MFRLDIGGGLGVPYKAGEILPSPAEYGAMVERATRGWDVQLTFEPGRVIAGNAGVLLTRVIRVKRGIASGTAQHDDDDVFKRGELRQATLPDHAYQNERVHIHEHGAEDDLEQEERWRVAHEDALPIKGLNVHTALWRLLVICRARPHTRGAFRSAGAFSRAAH